MDEGSDWLADYSYVDDGIVVAADFLYPSTGFNCWTPPPPFDSFSDASMEVNHSLGDSESSKRSGIQKRLRPSESFNSPSSGNKAVREKIRRDRLNERFVELGSLLEERGRGLNKVDKVVILNDAVRTVNHLRDETEKLKKSIGRLEEKIKDLKSEKTELRDENQKLKADKERLEVQFGALTMQQPTFLQPPHPSTNKVMPCIGYQSPRVAMWQYLPQAVVDTSLDHILRPPVA